MTLKQDWVAAVSLSLVLCAPLTAWATPLQISADNLPPGPGSAYRYQHPGGPHSLPYGQANGYAPSVAAHAVNNMPSVGLALQLMQARGYIRRQDQDISATVDGFACAFLAFEKPGHAISEMQPMVVIMTKPYEIVGYGWVPTTQVICTVFRDSSGIPVSYSSPQDSAIAVYADQPGTALTAAMSQQGPQPFLHDDYMEYHYSEFEDPLAAPGNVAYASKTSPGMEYLNSLCWRRVTLASGAAALSQGFSLVPNPGLGVARMTFAAVLAGCVTYTNFWMTPPDSTGH